MKPWLYHSLPIVPVVLAGLVHTSTAGTAAEDAVVTGGRSLVAAHAARGGDDAPQLSFSFDDEQRAWLDFFPLAFRRGVRGLRMGEMTLAERRATHALLRGMLSEEGYLRVQFIRELEEVLNAMEGGNSRTRVIGDYAVQLFGAPGSGEPWAFKMEGHHLSLNATLVGDGFRGTPLFLGASPAEVRAGEHAGARALAPLRERAYDLLESLDDEQRALAQGSDTTRLPGLGRGGPLPDPAEPSGLAAADMNDGQRALLLSLVEAYTENLREDFAVEELRRMRAAGVERLHFLWRGSMERGEPHSYLVQGPTLLVQLDAIADGGGDDANHLHAQWRDPERDHGADLIARHLERQHGE